jgi:hypothetical protein
MVSEIIPDSRATSPGIRNETDVEENDALCERLWAIERQVFDTPITSAIGMAIKASILVYNERDEDHYDSDGRLRLDQHALRGLAADVVRLLPEAKPLVARALDVPLMRPKQTKRKRRRGPPTLKLVVNNGATAALGDGGALLCGRLRDRQ